MTYKKLYEDALFKLEHNKITLGEFEEMIKPLEREVEYQVACVIAMNDNKKMADLLKKQLTIISVQKEEINNLKTVFDKIRAEIKQRLGTHGDVSLYNRAIHDVLDILDKCKTEGEE